MKKHNYPLTITALAFCATLGIAAFLSERTSSVMAKPIATYHFNDIAPTGAASELVFDNIEHALRNFEFDPERPDDYGPGLESTLRQASEEFSEAPPEEVLERINFLATKVLSEKAASIFSESLPLFIDYLIAEQELLNTAARPGSIQGEIAQFEKLSELRKSMLGEELNDLIYYKQNLFTHNLLTRRLVQSDDSLSEEEKQQRLQTLQEAMREAMSP